MSYAIVSKHYEDMSDEDGGKGDDEENMTFMMKLMFVGLDSLCYHACSLHAVVVTSRFKKYITSSIP